ncbi:unnamed protein product [Ectocarpus sp. 12 AP-2014]
MIPVPVQLTPSVVTRRFTHKNVHLFTAVSCFIHDFCLKKICLNHSSCCGLILAPSRSKGGHEGKNTLRRVVVFSFNSRSKAQYIGWFFTSIFPPIPPPSPACLVFPGAYRKHSMRFQPPVLFPAPCA